MLLLKYWKSILVTLIILFLSFARLPSLEHVPTVSHMDKIAHFSMYLFFTFILMFDFHKSNKQNPKKRSYLLICFAFPLFLGMITEIFQALFFFPRTAEWFDWLSNTAGVFAGWGVFSIFKRSFKP